MIFNTNLCKWFHKSKKQYPDFWIDYIDGFKNLKKSSIEETRFVAFDTETTGFDKKKG